MIFNSLEYGLFLPAVFLIYWLVPQRSRWIVLLGASYIFYAFWSIQYLLLLVSLTLAVFYLSAYIEKAGDNRKRRSAFFTVVIICIGVLFVFKYLNFFADNAEKAFSLLGLSVHFRSFRLLLPIGLSFYVFQMIGYAADVYNKKIKAELHLGYFAVFTSFFPQLLSGPIARAENLLPQIHSEKTPNESLMLEGAKILVAGYFKKCVVADNLAVFVDRVYGNLPGYRGFSLVLAAVFYSIQIYCDFSGYSDIAIGSARLLGIRLTDNFRQPYFSMSIREFWGRWHISLSTWFRDYVYIPLGGSRVKKAREYFNLFVTFLISGLWHGANWTFIFWGGIHGIAQILEKTINRNWNSRKLGYIRKIFNILIVFAFVTAAWVFFRADSIQDAFYVFSHMTDGIMTPGNYITEGLLSIVLGKKLLIFMGLFYLLPLLIYDVVQYRESIIYSTRVPTIAKWIFYIFAGICIFLFSPKGVAASFIYAQF